MKDFSDKPIVRLTVPGKDLGLDDQRSVTSQIFEEIIGVLQNYYRCDIVPQIDNVYGNILDNGSWTGMIGKLQRKEADIAVGVFAYTYARFNVVDFSSILRMEEVLIITKDAPKETNNLGILHSFQCVKLGVWISLFISYLAVSLCLNIGKMTGQTRPSKIRPFIGIVNCFLDLLPSIFGAGTTVNTSSRFSFHLLLSSYLVSIFFILSVMKSFIQTDQVVEIAPNVIETIHDLLNSRVHPMIPKGTFLKEYLQNHQNEEYREVYDMAAKDENGIIPHDDLGDRDVLEMFDKGERAFLQISLGIYWFQELLINATGRSDWYISRTSVFSSPLGIAVRKDLPLDVRKKLNLIAKSSLENGLVHKWMLIAFPHFSRQTMKSSLDNPEALNFTALGDVFYVHLVGMFISGSMLCCEILWSKVRMRVSPNFI